MESSRRGELGRSALMFVYFFLVITGFWILKPLKKALFVAFYDEGGLDVLGTHLDAAGAELLAKELNIAVAFVAALAFARLSARLRRARLAGVLSTFCAAACVVFSVLLRAPSAATVWAFYLFGDLFSTLMVAGFFAFLNDSVDADAAKRTYGMVGLGGVLGGVFGTGVLASFLDHLGAPSWTLVCAGLCLVVFAVAHAAGRLAGDAPLPPRPAESASGAAGARLVLGSRYYRSILGIVCIYEIVSSVMDFQFSWSVARFLDGDAIGRHFARVFLITNVASLLVQVFLTTPMMRRGVTAALLVLPLAAGLGSLSFALVPALVTGSMLNTCDNAFSYSIQQSARESLYVPRPSDEKYRAKAFIDMFGQRVAKGVGVLVSLGISVALHDLLAVRFLSVVTLALVALWVFLSRFAGKRFEEAAEHAGGPPEGRVPAPAA